MGGDKGLFGGVSQTLFGDGGAGAAQKMALAQQGQAQKNYDTVSGLANTMTTQGLANYDKLLTQQDTELSRQEQMVKQIDPTVLAASNQALQLLQGKSASSLAPIQAQRNQQRQQLLSNLRSQLGPGAETSTAGIQALNNFDMQTNSLSSQQQQSALGLANQTFGTFSGYGQGVNQSIGQMANLVGNRANLQYNQANLLSNAGQQLTQTAGSQYLGDYITGKQNAAFGQQMVGAAAQGGMMYATGGMSAMSKPSAPTPNGMMATNGNGNSFDTGVFGPDGP